ncbi:MAG: hypothetical protein H7289_01805 [Mucilaginibacter sp.]|nr:hypothetical protein [Mucilaginibacter sp.]
MKKTSANSMVTKKLMLLVSVILFCFTTASWAQTAPLPTDNPIKVAAPHLPLMVRHSGTGKVFYGDAYNYKAENATVMKQWMTDYSAEVSTYKAAIDKYLKETDVTLLADDKKGVYYDLKNQWAMISQL